METSIIIILGILLGRSLFCNKKLHDDRRKYDKYRGNPTPRSHRMTQKECNDFIKIL